MTQYLIKSITLFIFQALICHVVIAQDNTKNALNTIYISTQVDTRPEYKEGPDAFFQFIEENFRITDLINRLCAQNVNSIIVSFLVNDKGQLSDFKFGGSGIIPVEEEMKRTLSTSPEWKPATYGGQPCDCRVYINFRYTVTDYHFSINTSNNEMVVGYNPENKVLKYFIVAICLLIFYSVWTK